VIHRCFVKRRSPRRQAGHLPAAVEGLRGAPRHRQLHRHLLAQAPQAEIDVRVTGPSTARQMDENLQTLGGGPMSEPGARRIGDHIYGS
jgi:hypothetical protein